MAERRSRLGVRDCWLPLGVCSLKYPTQLFKSSMGIIKMLGLSVRADAVPQTTDRRRNVTDMAVVVNELAPLAHDVPERED